MCVMCFFHVYINAHNFNKCYDWVFLYSNIRHKTRYFINPWECVLQYLDQCTNEEFLIKIANTLLTKRKATTFSHTRDPQMNKQQQTFPNNTSVLNPDSIVQIPENPIPHSNLTHLFEWVIIKQSWYLYRFIRLYRVGSGNTIKYIIIWYIIYWNPIKNTN